MEITNGDVVAELPDTLARLLIENKGWRTGRPRRRAAGIGENPAPLRTMPPLGPTADDQAAPEEDPGDDDAPIPMTHVPGVIDGVSMRDIKKWVADGTVPHVLDGRTKLVKPSDVEAAAAQR